MLPRVNAFAAAWLFAAGLTALAGFAQGEGTSDPRLKEVFFDPARVITILVKRGVVTDVVLEPDEAITDVATGIGSDCAKPDSSWCVAAQAGGRHLFLKPKGTARQPNNIAVVTDKRSYSFRLLVIADGDTREPVYRLAVRTAPAASPPLAAAPVRPIPDLVPTPQVDPAERLAAAPVLTNSDYSMSEAAGSDDILPTLVFDDGRFTYLRFPNNQEIPAVFHVQPDGSETLVNVRMENDLLVVDRVSRRLMLRAGTAAVGIWNEAFDLDGRPPIEGTTAPGIARALKHPKSTPRSADEGDDK